MKFFSTWAAWQAAKSAEEATLYRKCREEKITLEELKKSLKKMEEKYRQCTP